MRDERGEVFMSVLSESEDLEVLCPIHGDGINHKVALDGVNISCNSLCLLTFTRYHKARQEPS